VPEEIHEVGGRRFGGAVEGDPESGLSIDELTTRDSVGRVDDLAYLETTSARLRQLAARDPNSTSELAGSLVDLGVGYGRAGRLEEAVAATLEAVDIYRGQVSAEPELRSALARALTSLGILYREMGQFNEAVGLTEEAVAIYREDSAAGSEGRGSLGTSELDWAFANLALALAHADPDGAEQLAGTITDPNWRARAFADLARAVDDTNRARILIDRALEATSQIAESGGRDTVLANLVPTVASFDPDRAEKLARTVTDPNLRAAALGDLARTGTTDVPSQESPTRLARAPSDWAFVVTIDTLGSQGPLGSGFLVNASTVLTSAAVVRDLPFVAVESRLVNAQAEPIKVISADDGGQVAVLRLIGSPVELTLQFKVPGFGQLQPGDRCEFPVSGSDGRFTVVGGVAVTRADGRFLIDLDDASDRILPPSGSPAMVGEQIAGIVVGLDSDSRLVVVPLTAFAGELAEFAPEVRDAVWPVSSPSPAAEAQERGGRTGVVLSERAERLLRWAAAVAAARSAPAIEPVDIVLGAMEDAQAGGGDHSANALYECLPEPPPRHDRLEAALKVLAISVAPSGPAEDAPEETAAALLRAASLVAAATTGGSQVHQRHLVAAALVGDVITPPVARALGADAGNLRTGMRSYIARKWPDEPSGEWERALAEPDVDLMGRFDGDQVVTWARRHRTGRLDGARELTDQLNLQVYAAMLATLIAGRSTADSLSIGLFGEWGSGKTTFMELIQRGVERLTTQARTSAGEGSSVYVTDIVPIWFNAWHYADANLWASLAAEMFDQLLGPRPDLDEGRQRVLRAELQEGQRRAHELRLASDAAQQRVGQLRTELADAERRREASRGRLNASILRRIAEDKAVKAQLVAAARDAGLDQNDLSGVATLAREVGGAVDDLDAIRKVLRRRRWTGVFIVTVVILVLLATAVIFQGEIRSLLGGLSIAGVAVVLGQIGVAIKGARAALGPLRSAAAKADEVEQRVIDQTKQDEQALVHVVVAAEGQAAVLSAQLDETLASVAAIEGQLQELTPGSRLYSFIAARAASSDYRSQLGVVSTIRRDFDQLAQLMAAWREARAAPDTQANEAKRPIDRIVLYIDDLDRCEPDQVVAVLQAVNLLVAMDLFIVVVGVDPRWLLRSLRRRYRSLLGPVGTEDGDISFRNSTPQDYLEKIFQVPFVLPGLSADGLGRLLQSLVTDVTRPPTAPSPTADDDGADRVAQQLLTPPTASGARHEPAELPVEQASQVSAAMPSSARALTVTRDVTTEELALLSRLHHLVRTPRSAKRLFNIYRLLRSTRDLRPAARFLGSDGRPGEYQAVAILLGVLTAHPELLGLMLWGRRADGSDESRALCQDGGQEGWRAFVGGLRPRTTTLVLEADVTIATDPPTEGPRDVMAGWENDVTDLINEPSRAAWVDLVDSLEELLGPEKTPFVSLDDIEPYRLWGPRVARFSFVLSAFASDEARSEITAGAKRAPGPNDPRSP
jgi:hypothetical protein